MSDPNASEAAAAAIQALWPRFAATALTPPVLQPAGLYLELIGEELRGRAYLVEGAQELCLRPDMTVPVLREAGAAGLLQGGAGVALGYDGLVFRKGDATAEFRQVGLEWAGPQKGAATHEEALLLAAVEATRACGVEPRLKLGHVGLAAAAAQTVGLGPAWRARVLRSLAKGALEEPVAADTAVTGLAQAVAPLNQADAERVVGELLTAAQLTPVAGRSAALMAARLRAKGAASDRPPEPKQLSRLRELLALEAPLAEAAAQIAAAGPPLAEGAAALERLWHALSTLPGGAPDTRFALGFGRGLAYYDGLVFELEAGGASLGGGGRYDGLMAALGGPAGWGAAGFALRPARLAAAGRS